MNRIGEKDDNLPFLGDGGLQGGHGTRQDKGLLHGERTHSAREGGHLALINSDIQTVYYSHLPRDSIRNLTG